MGKRKCEYCGKHKNNAEFYKGRKKCKSCCSKSSNEERLFRKITLVKMKGGKCQKCGYNKNLSALDFHHVKERGMERGLSLANTMLSWDKILQESEKCILVCKNCHSEIHNPQGEIKKPKEDLLGFDIEINICSNCHRETVSKRYCSRKCFAEHRRKVNNRPSKNELKDLTESMSWVKIGERYGVSDNAVRKWAKGYGLL